MQSPLNRDKNDVLGRAGNNDGRELIAVREPTGAAGPVFYTEMDVV